MFRTFRLPALLLSTALLGACASMGGSAPASVADGVFVGPNGMMLYAFDRDPAGAGKSVCNGPCATAWPPLMAPAGASASGDWAVVSRDDGAKQWAYKGKPVYFWAKDAKPGDRSGDGFVPVGAARHLVLPYAFDTNDMQFQHTQRFATGREFAAYVCDAMDWLLKEGAAWPRMLSVGLHLRMMGRVGRIGALERIRKHAEASGAVWVATREQIARHWIDQSR